MPFGSSRGRVRTERSHALPRFRPRRAQGAAADSVGSLLPGSFPDPNAETRPEKPENAGTAAQDPESRTSYRL